MRKEELLMQDLLFCTFIPSTRGSPPLHADGLYGFSENQSQRSTRGNTGCYADDGPHPPSPYDMTPMGIPLAPSAVEDRTDPEYERFGGEQ
jgi:hypothetical protein